MIDLNRRFIDDEFDENGVLKRLDYHWPYNFNFGYDVVDEIAAAEPDRTAMVWCNPAGDERRFTFGDISRLSNKAANFFRSMGVKKGDMVLTILKRHYQFWYVSVALHKLGAVMVPATFMLTKEDVEYRVRAASIKFAICTDQSGVPEAVDEAADIPTLEKKMIVNSEREGWIQFDRGMEEASEHLDRVDTRAEEPTLMYFSSGTSGYPKMVLHNHLYMLGHLSTAKYWQNVVPDGLHLSIADTGWGKAAWGKIYGQWIMEAGVFVYDYDKFEPHEILNIVEKYRITTLCCPPTMFRMFINAGLEGHDLSSLTYCCIAGEALNPDVFTNWYNATGIKLMEGFGQTETTCTVCNIRGMQPKPSSMGRPNPQYKVKLVDPDGNEVANGETGEIVISYEPRPPGLLMCYYRDEEKTEKIMHDGWFHTGDVAWRDEDGYFWYVGRNDDVIKSSGYKIGPFEIESVLVTHPAVLECAITGVPDPIRGQLVKATVVLRDGFEPSDDLKKELQVYVKHKTAPYKYPRVVEFVDELPKSSSGKIKRVDIRRKDEEQAKQ
ncbi:Acyl-coenzyme A synthetase/AMP-(fatty) acid ligase [Thermoplasmatales archaeon BRNA1]|nr:Acyl-coenzyme A synthetase/AMP-(fatty) acid ligase [Thermoplasmatales archaeon BRNA1]